MLSNVYQLIFRYYSHEKLYPITVLQWTNNSFSASDILFHGNTYFLSNCARRSYMHVFALVIFPYKANFVSSCPSQKRWQPFRTKAYCIKIWLFKALTNFMAQLYWFFGHCYYQAWSWNMQYDDARIYFPFVFISFVACICFWISKTK